MALREVGFPVIFNVIYMKVVFFSLLSMLNPISCFPRPILEGLGALKCLLLPEFGCCEQKKILELFTKFPSVKQPQGVFLQGFHSMGGGHAPARTENAQVAHNSSTVGACTESFYPIV